MAKSNLLECYLQSELHRVMRLSMRLQEPAMFTVCSGVNPVGEANTGLTGPDMALKIVFRFLQGLMDSTKVFCIKYTLHHSNKVFFTAQTYDLVTEFYISSLPRSKYFEHSFQLALLGTKCFLLYIFRLTIYPVSLLF